MQLFFRMYGADEDISKESVSDFKRRSCVVGRPRTFMPHGATGNCNRISMGQPGQAYEGKERGMLDPRERKSLYTTIIQIELPNIVLGSMHCLYFQT